MRMFIDAGFKLIKKAFAAEKNNADSETFAESNWCSLFRFSNLHKTGITCNNDQTNSGKFVTFIFMLSMISFACTSPAANNSISTERDNETSRTWMIEYSISGGFAGINRQLALSSNGLMTVTDEKIKKHIEHKVSQEQLKEISNILEQLDFSAHDKSPSILSKCADCFRYSLSIKKDDKKGGIVLDDLSLQGSKYIQLIRLLSSLMDESLK